MHADWSSAPAKRWMTVAELEGSSYLVNTPEPAGDVHTFLPRLLSRAEGAKIVVGFDFPIGLPMAYAEKAGITDFVRALLQFGTGVWSRFYDPAETASDISIYRPFYPARPGGTTHAHLVQGLGVATINDLRRVCERSQPGRNAACPLFWTLGANQVGRAAIIGWRDVLAPAIRDGRDVALWPFQGSLQQLIEDHDCVVAETYPAEACLHVGFTPPGRGWSKRLQEHRKNKATFVLDWLSRRPVRFTTELLNQVVDGFGSTPNGEDRFDSFMGLLSVIEVTAGGRSEGAPDDPVMRQIEGWILGQDGSANTLVW
ncbi:hypothetical protein [Desulfomonile tiedjei]|uniref:hypothetical protein n=1 Tax=Desulfomonile tiedjei TaxID=2358 RepID=UPI0002D2E76F|nr:hypothetical protein [Desulfomonile tiedjei]